MRTGSSPWAVEVKVNTSSGPGSYYSHGITQAVLYREFIREAGGGVGSPFFDWFAQKNLRAGHCRGMLVVEPIQARGGGTDKRRTRELQKTAQAFGVEVVEAVAVP